MTAKNYDFKLKKIESETNSEINKIIKNNLLKKSNDISEREYEIYFSSSKEKETVSTNEKGDPTIFRIRIFVKYSLISKNKQLFTNSLDRQVTYNNIDDKFELLKYEENIMQNLLENISSEILMSITNTFK
tara:strand:- start:164 stop:556 length:393 start_codon:yes stop_codon:yes gene_type:complete